MEKEKVKCSECDQLFRDRFNQWRHFMRKHCPENSKASKQKIKPVCTLCGQVFYKNGNLKRHTKLCKKAKPSSTDDLTFSNVSEFEEWKTNIERDTLSRFVRKSHYKLQNGSYRTKFCCHRSGFFKSQSKNIRRLKVMGSNKINGICPAKIISIVSPEGKVDVSFYPNHNGHSMELKRLTLSKGQKAEIADKIARKISFKEILNNMKKSSVDSKADRLHLLTKKDLRNIEKEFNINSTVIFPYTPVEDFLEESPNALNTTIDPMRFLDKSSPRAGLIPIDPSEGHPSIGVEQPGESVHIPSDEIHQQTFLVQVPPHEPESLHPSFHIESEATIKIESIKDEMRREFELVLSSIVNEEQALNGRIRLARRIMMRTMSLAGRREAGSKSIKNFSYNPGDQEPHRQLHSCF